MPFVAHRIFGWEPFEISESMGFRDISSGSAYPLCNSVACSECGILFLDIRFQDEQMGLLYEGYRGERYVAQRRKFEASYHKEEMSPLDYIHIKEQFILRDCAMSSGKSILDWGGDIGQSVVFNDGKNAVYSYDVGEPRQLKNGVQHFDISSGKTFDIITCSHVLEHVPYPIEFVANLKTHLKSDGVVFFELPLEQIMHPKSSMTLDERLHAKRHWHEHINFFSIESLKHVFDNAGFKVSRLEIVSVKAPGNFDDVIMANLHPD